MTDSEALEKWREWARVTFTDIERNFVVTDYDLMQIAAGLLRNIAMKPTTVIVRLPQP